MLAGAGGLAHGDEEVQARLQLLRGEVHLDGKRVEVPDGRSHDLLEAGVPGARVGTKNRGEQFLRVRR